MKVKFNANAEEAFNDWFHDLVGEGAFSLRSEWFFGDCEVGDKNTRKDLLARWLHAAYVSGYEEALNGY